MEMINDSYGILFLALLFVVAFLYASVGHGGASGYLALMALFGVAPLSMKTSALIMNVFVSLVSFLHYYKQGHFKWKLFYPFIITSIPLSFIGAWVTVDSIYYKMVLGALLLFPVARLFGWMEKDHDVTRPIQMPWALLLGASIGFLSGMIGIGGGIILSPVLLLLHWANLKETAAVSAPFIFINSLSGLTGLLMKGVQIEPSIWLWVSIALAGGFAGAWMGSVKFQNRTLRRVLGAVLLLASIKLLIPPTK